MFRFRLSLIFTIVLIVPAAVWAQATGVRYTEEFAGGTLQNGNIGENGWSVTGTPGWTVTRGMSAVSDQPAKAGQVGFVTVTAPAGQFTPIPSWVALSLGDPSRQGFYGLPGTSIPRILSQDIWQSEFTFALPPDPSGWQLMRVGLFVPGFQTPQPPPDTGCYVEYGARGDGPDPFGGAFKYVCYDGALYLTETSSGVVPDPDFGVFYTFRMRRNAGESFTMTITKAGSTSENTASARTLNPRTILSAFDLIPAFVVSQGLSTEAASIPVDYFYFRHDRIRR